MSSRPGAIRKCMHRKSPRGISRFPACERFWRNSKRSKEARRQGKINRPHHNCCKSKLRKGNRPIMKSLADRIMERKDFTFDEKRRRILEAFGVPFREPKVRQIKVRLKFKTKS